MLSTTRLLATVCTIALSPTVSAKEGDENGHYTVLSLVTQWSSAGFRGIRKGQGLVLDAFPCVGPLRRMALHGGQRYIRPVL